MNKATLACMTIVAICAAIVLFLDLAYPNETQKYLLLYRGITAYMIFLSLYFIFQYLGEISTYFKSRAYSPEQVSPEKSNIIYLHKEDDWFEVG